MHISLRTDVQDMVHALKQFTCKGCHFVSRLSSVFTKQHGQQKRKLRTCFYHSNYSIQKTGIMSVFTAIHLSQPSTKRRQPSTGRKHLPVPLELFQASGPRPRANSSGQHLTVTLVKRSIKEKDAVTAAPGPERQQQRRQHTRSEVSEDGVAFLRFST